MKILYLVNMNENNRKGLFTVTHEKLKYFIRDDEIDDYTIYSVQFYDGSLMKILKKFKNMQIRKKGADRFSYEGITYKKVYIKVGLINKFFEKINLDILNYLPMIIKHKKIIKESDIINAQWGYPHGRIAYFMSKLYGKKYIVNYYGSDIHTMPVKDSAIRQKLLKVMNNAHKNIFITNKLYEASKNLGYNKENYMVTKSGVNIDKFYPIDKDEVDRLKKENNLNGYIVGFVGNLNKIKRSDKLIEIFDNIKVNLKEEVSFVVVGDGPLKSSIMKEAKEKKLNILFTGNLNVEKVKDFMNVMDIMILPSRNEGFGSVVIEANACKTAVVGSNVGGICEAILNDNLLVDDGENFEIRFAEKVIEVLKSNYNGDDLINKIRENFIWEVVARNEMSAYRMK